MRRARLQRQMNSLAENVRTTVMRATTLADTVHDLAIIVGRDKAAANKRMDHLENRINGLDYSVAEYIDDQRKLSDRQFALDVRIDGLIRGDDPKVSPVVDHSRDAEMGTARRRDEGIGHEPGTGHDTDY